MTEPWPIQYLMPRNITRHLAPRTTAGTVATSGFTQRVSVPNHGWLITYEEILLHTEDQIRTWDAYEAYLDGGATPITVPLVGDSHGATDGVTVAAYPAGATVMQIYREAPGVQAGWHFTIGERLYRCFGVTALPSNNYQFSFRPPLRDAVAFSAAVSFTALFCRCRLFSDDEMTLKLEPGRYATGTVRFVEDPNTD